MRCVCRGRRSRAPSETLGPDHCLVRVAHVACAEQLVVASERSIIRIVHGVTELTGHICEPIERRIHPVSANDGCSGQMPLSITPTTTPSPTNPEAQAPRRAFSPRKLGNASVCSWRSSFGTTFATSGRRLLHGQPGFEAVERIGVLLADFRIRHAGIDDDRLLNRFQVIDVCLDLGGLRFELLTGLSCRRRQSWLITVVGHGRLGHHDSDVGLGRSVRLCDGATVDQYQAEQTGKTDEQSELGSVPCGAATPRRAVDRR